MCPTPSGSTRWTSSTPPAALPTCGSAPPRVRPCSCCGPARRRRPCPAGSTCCPTTCSGSPSRSSRTGCCRRRRRRSPGAVPTRSCPTWSGRCRCRARWSSRRSSGGPEPVRAALSGLTTRGRCLLAAGVAAALCGIVLGERDLLRVAVFLVALPLVAAAVVARTRFRLSCTRDLTPARVPAGQPATARLVLENVSFLPTGLLLLEDEVPYTLGGRPRFTVDRIGPGQHRTVHYPVRADARGRYRIGPLRLRLADPFGLVELTRSFTAVDQLTVVPAVQALPAVRLGGAWETGGESVSRSVAIRGDDDAATREYRHGDDLRKVHWRSTARVGKLMVRREERPWQSRATLLLDTRSSAHHGDGPASSFEWAVSAIASVGVHAARRGFSVRLITDAGAAAGGADIAAEGVLLDHLAEVSASHNPGLEAATSPLRGAEGLGTLIAVLGLLDADQAALLASTRSPSDLTVAVLVDASLWIGLSPRARAEAEAAYDAAAEILLRAGWRVLRTRHGDTLPRLWSSAGQRHASVAVGPPAAPAPTGTW